MADLMCRSKRMEAAEREACRMRAAMAAWHKAHPKASPQEVEGELFRQRRKLMARLLRILSAS